jgi:MazG family protein
VNDPQADHGALSEPSPGVLDRALTLVEFLRANCPWDAAQTPASLRRYLLEESHEVVAAVDSGNEEELRDELGDLLLNLAFQIVLAEERAAFDREGTVAGLEQKMRRRHPHLFGGQPESWERLKAIERGNPEVSEEGLLADLVAGADPVAYAYRVQARVAEVGFDWASPRGAWEKLREEIDEVGEELAGGTDGALEEEIGDLLFAAVNLARLSGVHPSLALQRANVKFARRFSRVEDLARASGARMEEMGLEALDELWDRVKREER